MEIQQFDFEYYISRKMNEEAYQNRPTKDDEYDIHDEYEYLHKDGKWHYTTWSDELGCYNAFFDTYEEASEFLRLTKGQQSGENV